MKGQELLKRGLYGVKVEELMEPGHFACAGCGAALAMRIASQVLPNYTRIVIPASCWSIIMGQYPCLSVKLPNVHTPFALAPGFATGMSASIKIKRKKATVLVWAGDGATYDIGFGAVSAAAERNSDMIYVCYDNEAYMNTGAQRSSSTPFGAYTPTTIKGKDEHKKDIISIIADHRASYVASASIAYPEDLKAKILKALSLSGFRFILIFCPCPTGWGFDQSKTVLVARLAVETGIFPLVEVENGALKISYEPSWVDLKEYLSLQGRFSNFTKSEEEELRNFVNSRWDYLRRRAEDAHL